MIREISEVTVLASKEKLQLLKEKLIHTKLMLVLYQMVNKLYRENVYLKELYYFRPGS